MAKIAIPKYLQVFKQVDDDIIDKLLKPKLIEIYEKGGCQVDTNYLKKNPNAKQKFMFVVSNQPKMNGTKIKNFDPNSKIGYWIYCGSDYYIRKVNEKYEFGNYMAYETKSRKVVDFWDEAKFKSLNNETSK
jgi:hypothetical protein